MIFSIENISKRFGDTFAVNNLSFSMQPGDIVGFVGPNGAGKTTTLRMLATLEQPTSGDIRLDNISILDEPDFARKHIGFVPDTLDAKPDMTVHEYLDFYARLYGIKHDARLNLLDYIEDFTNLRGIKDKFTMVLSKGMKQRVSIARALLNDPEILLMDEPAAGLDPRARIELRELLAVLAQKNKTILISSHILTELSEICNMALFIEKGKLLKYGRINDIVEEMEKDTSEKKIVSVTPKEKIKELCVALAEMPNVSDVNIIGTSIEFAYGGDETSLSNVIVNILTSGYMLLEFRIKRQNLESVFMNITKGDVQ